MSSIMTQIKEIGQVDQKDHGVDQTDKQIEQIR